MSVDELRTGDGGEESDDDAPDGGNANAVFVIDGRLDDGIVIVPPLIALILINCDSGGARPYTRISSTAALPLAPP